MERSLSRMAKAIDDSERANAERAAEEDAWELDRLERWLAEPRIEHR